MNKPHKENCKECSFEKGHSLECKHYVQPRNPINQDKEKKLELRDWLPDFKKFFILLFGVMLPWILLLSLLTNGLCD